MEGRVIRLGNILEFVNESGKIGSVGFPFFFSIWESSVNEKATCTLTKPSIPATSHKGRTEASLGLEGEGKRDPIAEQGAVAGGLGAASVLNVGASENWPGRPLTEEGERETRGIIRRGAVALFCREEAHLLNWR